MSTLDGPVRKRSKRTSQTGSRLDLADDVDVTFPVASERAFKANAEINGETNAVWSGHGPRCTVQRQTTGSLPAGVESESDREFEDSSVTDRKYSKELVLPVVDHGTVAYADLKKNVYVEMPRLSTASGIVPQFALRALGVVASGTSLLAPIERFQDLALSVPQAVLGILLTKYSTPTTVQRAVIPNALAGRDIVAVAKTGSGKTVAYALPVLAHIAGQTRREFGRSGSGPSALVITPTRELALQVSSVLRSFASPLGLVASCIVGGIPKYEQYKQLRDGRSAIAVFTPGRFIDMMRMKACGLTHVSIVVVDEADRMIEAMGFGPQLKTILSQVRPDAQKVFASATFPPSVHQLAATYLADNFVRLVVGRASTTVAERERQNVSKDGTPLREGSSERREILGKGDSSRHRRSEDDRAAAVPLVSDDVDESYILVISERSRFEWLVDNLSRLLADGLVIVFGSTRGGVANLSNQLRARGFANACVHGETEMADRAGLMAMFRSGELGLLVATDVAGRGLDISGVRNVVSFEPAKNWDDHVHRSGRTGRAGVKGSAYTLLVASSTRDQAFARSATAALQAARVPVPRALAEVVAEAPEPSHKRGRRAGSWRGNGGRGGRRMHF